MAAPAGAERLAIRAARDLVYEGEIAEEMARFSQEQGGLLTLDDLKEFSVKVEPPEVGRFREYDVYTCGPWCQGPVVAQTLQTLAGGRPRRDLGTTAPTTFTSSPRRLNLSFADRHRYYGDPDHVDVPMAGLLSVGLHAGAPAGGRYGPSLPGDGRSGQPVALPGTV